MSRITRSQQAVADENAVPREGLFRALTKRGTGLGGVVKPQPPAPPPPPAAAAATAASATVPVLATKPLPNSRKTSARPALGDISNQLQKSNNIEQLPKKKRIEEVEQQQHNIQQQQQQQQQQYQQQQPSEAVEDDDDVIELSERPQQNYEEGQGPLRPNNNSNSNHDYEDVDMRHDDEAQRSLEDSVAEMKLAEIDAADASNPQCVPEYINEIMSHLFEVEVKRMVSPTYMQRQTDINVKMREILVDWLVEVHLKFKLRPETLYLTINIIDRFLERRAVSRTKLQLVGCTAMLMAAKYEEIYAPEVRDFVYISDQAYTKEQILSMESIMLNTLGFYLTVPTTLRFGERLCRVGRVSPETENCVRYLMELTLQDAKFLRYRPSEIAAAAAFLGLKMTGQHWDATLEHHAGYDRARMNEVLVDLQELASRDPPKYKAVRKKYLQKKFLEVSKIPVCAI